MGFSNVQCQPLIRRQKGKEQRQCRLKGASIACGEQHHLIRIEQRMGCSVLARPLCVGLEQQSERMSIDLMHNLAHMQQLSDASVRKKGKGLQKDFWRRLSTHL